MGDVPPSCRHVSEKDEVLNTSKVYHIHTNPQDLYVSQISGLSGQHFLENFSVNPGGDEKKDARRGGKRASWTSSVVQSSVSRALVNFPFRAADRQNDEHIIPILPFFQAEDILSGNRT